MPANNTQTPMIKDEPSNSERRNEQSTSQGPDEDTYDTISIRSTGTFKDDGLSRASTTMSLYDEVTKYNEIRDSENFEFYPGTEQDVFDDDFTRHGIHKTNLPESVAHLVKGTLGAGVMTMHEAFMTGGLWTSLATIVVTGIINYYAMYILGSTAQLMYNRTRLSRLSYPDLAEMAAATGPWKRFRRFSKCFRYTVDLCIVSCMGGTCCIYQIMIAKTFKLAIEGLHIDLKPWLHDDIRMYILCVTPVLLCICVIRSLKILAPFSMISDILIALCVLTTLHYSLQTGAHITDRPAWKNTYNFMKLVGICVYCTCGIGVCLPVENNMKRPRYFNEVLTWAMATVTVFAAFTGFFGYWGWGEACKSPLTVHLPISWFTVILQFLIGFMLCVTFSVQFWVPFRIFWYYINHRFYKRSSRQIQGRSERIHRFFLVIVVACVAITFPNLMPIMAFIGHFFLGFIGFVFPALIEILVTWREDRRKKIRWRLVKNLLFMAFGIFLSVSSIEWRILIIF